MTEKEILTDLFNEAWEACSLEDKVAIHNIYAQEECADDIVYENDESFFDDNFGSPLEAVRATYYGDYTFTDDYVWFNGCGNLDSGSYEEEMPFDLSGLQSYFIDHYSDLSQFPSFEEFCDGCRFGVDTEGDEDEIED